MRHNLLRILQAWQRLGLLWTIAVVVLVLGLLAR